MRVLAGVPLLALLTFPLGGRPQTQDSPQAQGAAAEAAPAAVSPEIKLPDLTDEQRGDIYMARKRYRDAIDAYNESLKKSPNFLVYNKLGIAQHSLQMFSAAKRSYERSLKLNPKYAEARNNIGALYHAQKNYRGAVREYQRALKINPNSATIYANMGAALFARKKYKEAEEAMQKALAIDPNVYESRSQFGTILQERSVEERARYHYFMAKAYARAGQTERALQSIRRSLEEGFRERKRYLEEPEFAGLRELPEFKKLMAAEFRAL